jgi:hypothetical protein
MRIRRSREKSFDADILSPAGWRAVMVISCFAITGMAVLTVMGQAPNLKTSARGGVEITTRPGDVIEAEVIVRDMPTDREKIEPEKKVADAPPPTESPKPKEKRKHADDGSYYATVKVNAYQTMIIRRKCIPVFDWPEQCSLPPEQRESRPKLLD